MTSFSVFLLCISPCVGSFLALLVDRLPRDEDVIRTPSACRSCRTRLGWADLIPMLSFVLSRGRCRRCGAVIPPWVLYAEILAMGAGVLAISAGGSPLEITLTAVMLWALIALALTDLLWLRLPDALTLTLALATFGLAALPIGIGLAPAFWGAVFGAGSFWAVRVAYKKLRGRDGLGLGDVKLMVGLGALAGPYELPVLVLVGAVIGLGLALWQRKLDAHHPVPFGAALCCAGALIWLFFLA
ncbi:Type 4 prepilin-like proteins leader peptide-processing enzyme [Ascidiaceihabitans donghaensis]|uniref:Prepilin leader peptidase/N-methyltransferase n=1 Tax=Ascidiaceihabitans donghaensis TaxID=1510460 RepID=A0A2R8BPH9_9RHOB|nr:A24 family peptidase [Ascidiaceihabitans donghaensis]SPH27486.1 Type 4 prepilin-like proteins leader peptide-processing enzyme [Ascidiaceihabitans donghaensis]